MNPTQLTCHQTRVGHENSRGYEVALWNADGTPNASLGSVDVLVGATTFDPTEPGSVTFALPPRLFEQDFGAGTYVIAVRPYGEVRDATEWALSPAVAISPDPSPVANVLVS